MTDVNDDTQNGSPDTNPNDNEAVAIVPFSFKYSAGHRVVPVNGAWGGVTPNGRSIQMGLFHELKPLPSKVLFAVEEDGALGEEVSREIFEGICREIELTAFMEIPTAMLIRDWLTRQIEHAKNIGVVQLIEVDDDA